MGREEHRKGLCRAKGPSEEEQGTSVLTSPAGSWPLLAGRSQQPCRHPWSLPGQMPGDKTAHGTPRSVTPSLPCHRCGPGGRPAMGQGILLARIMATCRRRSPAPTRGASESEAGRTHHGHKPNPPGLPRCPATRSGAVRWQHKPTCLPWGQGNTPSR